MFLKFCAAELCQLKALVPVLDPLDGPLGGEQQQLIALVVLHQLGVVGEQQVLLLQRGASSSSFTIQRRYSKGRPSLYSSTLYSLRRRYSSTSN